MEGYLPLLFIVVMFLGFYFLMVRPAQRRQKEARALVAELEIGQEVMTTAGIYGTLSAIDDDTVELEVSPGVRMKYAKQAIARIVEPIGSDAPAVASDATVADTADTVATAHDDAAAVVDGDKRT